MNTMLLVSNVALWAVVILQTLFILALFRYFNLLLNRIPAQGLPLGKSAPRRELVDIEGKAHVLGEPSSRHQVLIFTSPNCPWCKELAPHFVPFTAALEADYDLLLVVHDQPPAGEERAYAERMAGGARIDLAVSAELFESYGVPGTPYGMLIDKDGIVRTKGTANTLTDLQTLVRIRS